MPEPIDLWICNDEVSALIRHLDAGKTLPLNGRNSVTEAIALNSPRCLDVLLSRGICRAADLDADDIFNPFTDPAIPVLAVLLRHGADPKLGEGGFLVAASENDDSAFARRLFDMGVTPADVGHAPLKGTVNVQQHRERIAQWYTDWVQQQVVAAVVAPANAPDMVCNADADPGVGL